MIQAGFNIYFPYNSFQKIKIGKNEFYEIKALSLGFKLSQSAKSK